jgi:acyl carrier protein
MTQEEVFHKVREAFVEALGVDDDEVEPSSRIFEDLGAESLDLLEIVYLLEHSFQVQIPRDGVAEATKEDIDPSDYEVDGVLTELALGKLREVMPEVPADEIAVGLTANDIPRLFRVQTFINIVTRLLAEKGASVEP